MAPEESEVEDIEQRIANNRAKRDKTGPPPRPVASAVPIPKATRVLQLAGSPPSWAPGNS